MTNPHHKADFDSYAQGYEQMHAASIGLSGESTEYFAIYKQRTLERLLGPGFAQPVLDFGCGIGNLTRHLTETFSVVHGYDPSTECADIARTRSPRATFFDDAEAIPQNHYGAVVLANVLHHVPPPNRPGLMATVARTLCPGGKLVIFEHNPLNPLTRRAVAACAFDDDAELLFPWAAKRLLRDAGLTKVMLDFIVFFPHGFAKMRGLEPKLAWLPLGAQVCAFGTKR